MQELITLLMTISGAMINARYDANEIKGHRYILKHGSRAIIRGIAIVAIAYFVIPIYSWPQFLLAIAVLAFTFWLIFDIAINVNLGKYWLRIGKTSTLDKLLQHLGEYNAFALKLGLWIASMIAYLMHYDTLFY